ncbi:MAG: carbohydrate porin [Candidatus Dadabacteria bacterium]|nr:carbohydrate porin [Candidatus Dadabacteria bacterium]
MTLSPPKILLIIFSILIVVVSQSVAQDTEVSFSYNRDLRSDEVYDSKNYLTGDWGGIRGKLNNLGITPIAKYYTTILGNPVGGKKKGVQYAGLLNAYLKFDLEKLLSIKRSKFIVSGSWATGRSLSGEDIGNFFTASEVFSGRSVRLYQLFFESELLENFLRVAVGRMGIADEFSTSEIFYNYVSTAIDAHPISLAINDAAYFSVPQASWAARIHVTPTEKFYIKAGVYNSNPAVGRDSAHGVDFSFRKGVIVISEIGYLHNQKQFSKGLRGRYTFGAFYDTRKFDELANESEKQDGNYGLYWIVEQMIYREMTEDDQGLTPWAALTISPDESINTFPFFISGGFIYKGLVPNRNYDKAAFGFAYGTISDDIKDKDYELMLELTYIIQATPWLKIQPDVQWIVHPGGSSDIPNALVLGMQLVVDI